MFDRIRLFRALLHDARSTDSDLLAFAVLAFGIPDKEGCHPSQQTIATLCRRDRKTVRRALNHLAELEALTIERQQAGNRVIGTLYSFPAADRNGESTPRQCPQVGRSVPHQTPAEGHPAPHAMGENAPSIDIPDSQNRTGPAILLDLEVEQIARRVQQCSAGPWRLENARRAVVAAAQRAGIAAVKELAEQLYGAGLRAYDITRRLEMLTPDKNPADPPSDHAVDLSDQPSVYVPTPKHVRKAVAFLESEDWSTRAKWHRTAQAMGAKAALHQLDLWVPQIAAAYLEAEHWRTWQSLVA
jgi:hypothetical protein